MIESFPSFFRHFIKRFGDDQPAIFAANVKYLRENIIAAYAEEGQDVKEKATKMCKEFDSFNIEGIKLENSYAASLSRTDDLIADIKDFLFLAERRRKQNVPAVLKKTRAN